MIRISTSGGSSLGQGIDKKATVISPFANDMHICCAVISDICSSALGYSFWNSRIKACTCGYDWWFCRISKGSMADQVDYGARTVDESTCSISKGCVFRSM